MSRVRLLTAALLAAAVAVPVWAPWRRTLPEVTRGNARCLLPSEQPATGSLVPDVRYRMVQLCRGDRAPFRILDDRTSAELVKRINALPSTPPSPTCTTTVAEAPVDLVLRAANSVVAVRLDTGPCGTAHRNGLVRYGAGDLYRYTACLLAFATRSDEPRLGEAGCIRHG